MTKYNYQKVCSNVLSNLTSERHRQVLARRFGLKNKRKETLQKIGGDFSVTRERVRQIENEAFAKLVRQNSQTKSAELKQVFSHFAACLKKNGGLKKEKVLLNELGGDDFENHISFLLTLGSQFYRFPETDDTYAFWAFDSAVKKQANEVISDLTAEFSKIKKPMPDKAVLVAAKNQNPQFVFASIEVSKKLDKGPLGEIGLSSWTEIRPRGVRDAAFIALKSKQNPLHFREIAQCANDLAGECLGGRKVLPQTVHNELIRDDRFVLVGRGMYALRDWGYCSGTVKDVITAVLKKAKAPLARQKILEAVQEQRLVKDNTVFLNLSDKDYFVRNEKGKYTLV